MFCYFVLVLQIMPKKSKAVRSQYSVKDLETAVDMVKCGKMSIRKAAKNFHIPKSTIGDRISGRVPEGAKVGKSTVFLMEVENKLAGKVKEAAAKGFGLSRMQLAAKAAQLAKSLHLRTPFTNGIPGKDWISGFMNRHPDISLRLPTPLSTCRARCLNTTLTSKYFCELEGVLKEKQPLKVWNIDETSVPLLHKPTKVLAATGSKNIPGRVGNSRDNVSVLFCIEQGGYDIPPLCIVKGKTSKALQAYDTARGPTNAKYTYQTNAWMEDILGEVWFKEHFIPNCGKERPQLILLDSHSSHETLGIIEAARNENIILLAFPPHTTQWLCPLDKSVFSPLSREYNRVCSEFMAKSLSNIVNKWEWPSLFQKAYDKTVTKANIKAGFEKCGICPLNPKAIPETAYAPSIPFDCPVPDADRTSHPVVQQKVSNTLQACKSSFSSNPNANPPLPPLEKVTAEPCETFPKSDQNDQNLPTFLINPYMPNMTAVEVIDLPQDVSLQLSEASATGQEVTLDVSLNLPNSSLFTEILPLSEPLMANWQENIDEIFHLPAPASESADVGKKKRVTSHRLLTSDDIYQEKRDKKAEKENLEKEKFERKVKRLEKKKAKEMEKNIKKEKKMKTNAK